MFSYNSVIDSLYCSKNLEWDHTGEQKLGLPIHLIRPLDKEEMTNGGRVVDFHFVNNDDKFL